MMSYIYNVIWFHMFLYDVIYIYTISYDFICVYKISHDFPWFPMISYDNICPSQSSKKSELHESIARRCRADLQSKVEVPPLTVPTRHKGLRATDTPRDHEQTYLAGQFCEFWWPFWDGDGENVTLLNGWLVGCWWPPNRGSKGHELNHLVAELFFLTLMMYED